MTAVAAPRYFVNFDAIRNAVFFAAVLAMIFTLLRPSPTDLLVAATGFLCLFVNQRISTKFLILVVFLLGRGLAIFLPTIPFLGDKGITFELWAHGFVIILCLVACYVSSSWDSSDYTRFIRVYVAAAVTAASLAIAGFIFHVPGLTWDSRGSGLFDDPNMYGSFVVPSVLCCIYMATYNQGRRWLWITLAVFLAFGVLLSFSRAATVGLLLTGTAYLGFLNRTNVKRLLPTLLTVLIAGGILFTIAYFVAKDLDPEMLSRLTVAKEYDKGHFGRYSRYALSIPMILDNPMGLGLLQQEKIFPEPIHNIFLSSFFNYGWLGGVVWVTLFISSIINGIANYRYSRNPLAILLLFTFLAPIMCAFLHEGEHWRHLWMFIGLLWGFRVQNFRPLPETATVPVPVPKPLPHFVADEIPRGPRKPVTA